MGGTQQAVTERRRVLIAEDEALIRLDLAEMLVEEGYEVVAEAGDGEAAVRLAEELKPDLVILDIKMPVMDGLAAAERIAEARLAPVVILTAFSQRDLVERARAAGPWRTWSSRSRRPTWSRPSRSRCRGSRRSRRWSPRSPSLAERLETRKARRAGQGRPDDQLRHGRAAGVQLDPADRDGPPDDDARGRRADPGGDPLHRRHVAPTSDSANIPMAAICHVSYRVPSDTPCNG